MRSLKMKTVGLTFDLKSDYKFKKGDPADANAELDSPSTLDGLHEAIEELGFKVKRIGNVYNLLKELDNLGVDIVFNIAEGMDSRNRESQVPVILETQGIPFVGSDGLTLGLTLDKLFTKKLFIAEEIPTPRFFEAKSENSMNTDHLSFPLFVKPRYEGSSKGLSDNSKVSNHEELKRQIGFIVKTYRQPALVEEFIPGYELTVAIVGNDPPEVFPPVQTKIDGRLIPGDLFYSFGHLFNPDRIEYIFPPKIDKVLQKKAMDLALRSYNAVDCRDFGRVDIRMDEKGNPFVLEINPLPCLSKEDVFYIIAQNLGISFAEMIGRIIKSAFKRYNLEI